MPYQITNIYSRILRMVEDEEEKLIVAAETGDLQEVQNLLKQGVDVNCKLSNACPLIKAIVKNQKNVIEVLLQQKELDVNREYGQSTTALVLATKRNYEEITKLLLRREDIDVNHQGGSIDNISALGFSILNFNWKIFKKLLRRKDIDVNFRCSNRVPFLKWVFSFHHKFIFLIF